ncbi:hypothetical protein [Gordonia crocea]|uniref:Uncharacterized protein n=1 Tax=Gordonia crocea TaxID=589162 RepID=A0A7I9UZG3_9ACTN|nr:hypothetical protein [Gordonia crocea]GED98574.1 hypothetical protein nbrc107697_26130 [Gordonia crocea]
MNLSFLVGPVTVVAAVAAFLAYVATVYLREKRGGDARIATLADSHPVTTAVVLILQLLALAALVIRLGVMA